MSNNMSNNWNLKPLPQTPPLNPNPLYWSWVITINKILSLKRKRPNHIVMTYEWSTATTQRPCLIVLKFWAMKKRRKLHSQFWKTHPSREETSHWSVCDESRLVKSHDNNALRINSAITYWCKQLCCTSSNRDAAETHPPVTCSLVFYWFFLYLNG